MMRIKRLLFYCLFGVGALAGGSLHALPVDLTPQPHDYLFDSVPFHGIKFIHGKEWVMYTPPPGWSYSGDAKSIALKPSKGVGSARVEIAHQDNTAPPSWDHEGINALFKRALAVLPPLAQNMQLVDFRKNPLIMGGHDTALLVFTGTLFAQNYKFSVVLLPLQDEQFSFLMFAEKSEYESAASVFMRSLYSVHWEKPTP